MKCVNLQWNHVFEIILLYSECIQFLSDNVDRQSLTGSNKDTQRKEYVTMYNFCAAVDTVILQDMVAGVTSSSASKLYQYCT